MHLTIIEHGDTRLAQPQTEEQILSTLRDATDLIGNAYHQGANCVILQESHLHPDFFDLKTGLAGEILQKYSNYQIKMAIIGNFTK